MPLGFAALDGRSPQLDSIEVSIELTCEPLLSITITFNDEFGEVVGECR